MLFYICFVIKKVYPQPNNTPEKLVTFTSFDFVNLTFYT